MPTSKTRISVPMSPEIATAVRIEAQKIGVSESAYCAFIIGQHITAQSQVYNVLNDTLSKSLIEQKEKRIEEIAEIKKLDNE